MSMGSVWLPYIWGHGQLYHMNFPIPSNRCKPALVMNLCSCWSPIVYNTIQRIELERKIWVCTNMSLKFIFISYFWKTNNPNSQRAPENLKKFRQKKTREIAFLAVLNFFHSSKIDFWPFLKLQKMEFGLNIFS